VTFGLTRREETKLARFWPYPLSRDADGRWDFGNLEKCWRTICDETVPEGSANADACHRALFALFAVAPGSSDRYMEGLVLKIDRRRIREGKALKFASSEFLLDYSTLQYNPRSSSDTTNQPGQMLGRLTRDITHNIADAFSQRRRI